MHLDRGQIPVDHHCFFIFEGPVSHVHHSSFETHDFDTQLLGHHWLRQKGYKNCWGVGRHILGSQIFDYWCVSKKSLRSSIESKPLLPGLTRPDSSSSTMRTATW